MSISKDRTKAFEKEIRRRLFKGVNAGIERAKEGMVARYSANQSPPTSGPGETPHMDSGQLVDNIAAHMNTDALPNIEGGVGVYGKNTPKAFRGNRYSGGNIGGLAAVWLSRGHELGTWRGNPSGNPFVVNGVRMGLDDSFMEDRLAIESAIAKGATT